MGMHPEEGSPETLFCAKKKKKMFQRKKEICPKYLKWFHTTVDGKTDFCSTASQNEMCSSAEVIM